MNQIQALTAARMQAVRRANLLRAMSMATGFPVTKDQINHIIDQFTKELTSSGLFPLKPTGLGGYSRKLPIHELSSLILSVLNKDSADKLAESFIQRH